MNYAKIKHFDIANGEGVRTSLFVSGCQFHCEDCFNSETWDYNYGNLYTKETENHILSTLQDRYIDGLSILGGDPLWQDEDGIAQLTKLVEQVKSIGKTVWIWSGFTWEQLPLLSASKQNLIKLCDVMIDGLYNKTLRDLRLKWRGSSNQRVINIQQSIKEGKVIEV